MKTPALQRFRQKLAADKPVYGLYVTLESASITEMAVALGLDWVVVDAEHGHLDWGDILAHVRATVRSHTVALVRITELNTALVKRVLDIGADGIVVPWVESAEQLRDAVSCARYPPEGRRGIGGERATCWGHCMAQHVVDANENVLVVPLIESVEGGRHIDEMVAVDGVEVFFFGPADYSSSAGHAGQWEGPGVADRILAARDAIRAAGRHCGVVGRNGDDLKLRLEQGFRVLGLGMDGGMLLRCLKDALGEVAGERDIAPSLAPAAEAGPAATLPRPPEAIRPDRPAAITPVGHGAKTTVAAGVEFEALAGAHNGARELTTGILTFAPGATQPCHRHGFCESMTLLRGRAAIEVEGRTYQLGPRDGIAVPPGLAHTVTNCDRCAPATLHLAAATDRLERRLVDRFYTRRPMGRDLTGTPGAERITRFGAAPRHTIDRDVTCVDCFGADLMDGMAICGGWTLFQPGARLPAHVHPFDESICIVEGAATCVVEGQHHRLADGATAFQPRGRVHYVANDGADPMAMIWVVDGPRPERLLIDERCATTEPGAWAPAEDAT